jgi:hypothetical protein
VQHVAYATSSKDASLEAFDDLFDSLFVTVFARASPLDHSRVLASNSFTRGDPDRPGEDFASAA